MALIRRYYAAYAKGDLQALREFFAPEIRWTIPGRHPLAGAKVGVREVLAYRIQRGKIVEAINFAADQHAADAFFWQRYPLAPLPDRLLRTR
ncbi:MULTISPECIES: nuclear transport factor 2 family protein [unclassified Crossiella]|uniref:nuclear transport factor 2 family protein n=1 Tax=unclassified Crossiella TaxID=2620835 RepID=UPI00200013BF|nr:MULTISPECIES: nuclear transport factor 2 family protein [unclassified Crossiella]MCK2242838.1 nuclear transport factor 2 family protein [Crossiella sp. S99.2]MCK2256715.1 nuclear transport factor 2 family protein [Crossiella sp. S99.1]